MLRIGIDRVPSDYDLQLSSDVIVARCEQTARAIGMTVTRETTIDGSYDFVRKDLLRAAMRHLSEFGALMSDALQRDVTIAVFDSAGPPDKSATIGALSSHFRDSDWCLAPPITAGTTP